VSVQQTVRTPRLWVRRTVFLLAGGAVAAALAILASALIAPVREDVVVSTFVALLVVLLVGVGLLPGVREVQVAGAQALLGLRPESVTAPEPMRWAHRWRTALWTLIHQLTGALTGLLIVAAGLPIAGLLVWLLDGGPIEIPGWTLRAPTTLGGWALAVLTTMGVVGVAGAVIAGLGLAAAASAPSLLGPVGEDRLRMAEQRLEREQATVRLSRDLHDGVGHSLSAISLHAGAGRRAMTGGGDPDAVVSSLRAIEELSGRAVQELDDALAVLRGEATKPSATAGDEAVTQRAPVPRAQRVGHRDLHRLGDLVSEHRDRGMRLDADLLAREQIAGVPSVISCAAYRIVAEALTNAAKHGADNASVSLTVRSERDALTIDVRNAMPMPPEGKVDTAPRSGGGRGLDGLGEQVDMLDGTMTAEPEGALTHDARDRGWWRLRVELPTGGVGRA